MSISKQHIKDFTILALRWYLAYYMFDYGISKLMGEQFGVHDPRILDMPVRQVDRFYLAWHLFGLSRPFNIIVGIFQIIGGLLLIINRTALIGALFLLPIIANIFLIDLAFTTNVFGAALTLRLACMMLSDGLVLYYYREKIVAAFRLLTTGISTRFRYKWWTYLLLIPIGLLIDFAWAIIIWPLKTLVEWLMK
jgi:uncharacterized membrane protein YphA (DoxX/SURF4 family)